MPSPISETKKGEAVAALINNINKVNLHKIDESKEAKKGNDDKKEGKKVIINIV